MTEMLPLVDGGAALLFEPFGRIGSVYLRVLAEELGHDMLPGPFYATSGLRHDPAAYYAEEARIRRALREAPPMDLSDWFEAMDKVDVTLRAVAWRTDSDPALDDAVRINAVRHGPDGFVALQEPSDPEGESGDIVVWRTDAVSLADAVVSLLPKAPKGAKRFLEHSSRPRGSGRPESEPKLAAHGYVEVVKYAATSWLPAHGPDCVRWMNVEGDGRYILRKVPEPARWPAGDEGALVAAVNGRIAKAISAIKDDRRYAWERG